MVAPLDFSTLSAVSTPTLHLLVLPMNRHTFQDAVKSRREALANEIEDDDDDDDDDALPMRGENHSVEGEEDDGQEKFNDVGEVMEPFNLRDEREGGRFDANMNYVWNKETEEVDRWIADLDEAEMEKSIGEAAKSLKRKQEKQAEDDSKPDPHAHKDRKMLIQEIVGYLREGETILQGIRRIGKEAKSNPNSRATSSSVINLLTELADLLLSRGDLSVYDIPREGLYLMVMKWEYMGQDQQIHGPYTSKEMYEWMQQGFFTGDNAVYMREYQGVGVGSTPKNSAGNLVGTSKEVENDFESDEEVENGEAESKGPNSSQFPSAASIYSSWTLSDDIDWSVMQDIAAPETEKGKALLQNRADDDDRDDDGRLYKRKRNEMKDEDSGEDD